MSLELGAGISRVVERPSLHAQRRMRPVRRMNEHDRGCAVKSCDGLAKATLNFPGSFNPFSQPTSADSDVNPSAQR